MESREDGSRHIKENVNIDETVYEICGYSPTREGCYPLLFLMKPSVKKNIVVRLMSWIGKLLAA